MPRTLIFAYGSNMHPARMQARVPAAVPRGRARLRGHRLVFNKLGRDGSAKANLVPEPDGGEAEVWGVLWELDAAGLAALDPHEGGYRRVRAEVETDDGACVVVETYLSERLTNDPVPFDWYLEHVLRGARAHGLPEAWVARLELVVCRPDPREGAAP